MFIVVLAEPNVLAGCGEGAADNEAPFDFLNRRPVTSHDSPKEATSLGQRLPKN
jgi:hypothetical protein